MAGLSVSDTSPDDIPLTTLGTFVEITNLACIVSNDIADGDPLDTQLLVHVINQSDKDSGSLTFGYGINGAIPTAGSTHTIGESFSGSIPVLFKTTNHGGLSAGDVIKVYGRRTSEEKAGFNPLLQGSTRVHELTISVSADAGATLSPEIATGTTLDIDNVLGTIYNKAAPGSATTYTLGSVALQGYAKCYINAPTEPAITGAGKITGDAFVADTDMWMIAFSDDGSTVQFYFQVI